MRDPHSRLAEKILPPLKLSGVLTKGGNQELTGEVTAASAHASPSPGEAAGLKKAGTGNGAGTGRERERTGEPGGKRE